MRNLSNIRQISNNLEKYSFSCCQLFQCTNFTFNVSDSGSLRIPSHIRLLHVEQEVVGDETLAIDSVLECDTKRCELLAEEKQLNSLLNTG